MTLQLHNTLTRQKETFTPLDTNSVGMYVCGPTVYNRAHIGNARAVVVFDCLYRLLRHLYGEAQVNYVRNITDVDDKINIAAKERGISIAELTTETTALFHEDMTALNCLRPNHEPRATAHITQMIHMIESLINKGFAYANANHVLFNTTRYAEYGALSNRSLEEMIAGARVEVAPYKENPSDFVLWKPSTEDEPGWDSPWGYGRPGWHIECSVMSTEYLGSTFDIHGGGADLQFPHHENEIAQSRCAHSDSHYARYWVHNGFLTVNGEKMSKSLGNFITVDDLLNQNIPGEAIRLALLSTHYRKPLDWNDKALNDAKKSLDNFYKALQERAPSPDARCAPEIIDALCDDLNLPQAMATLHQLLTQFNKHQDSQTAIDHIYASGQLLGFFQQSADEWFAAQNAHINAEEVEALIAQRKQARADKNWAESDRIRDQLTAMNILLEDSPDGTTTWRSA